MHPIDYTLLRQLVPHYRARPGSTRGAMQEQVLMMLGVYLEPTLDRWGINTFLRKAHFLGQSSVESRDYTSMVEDNDDGVPVSGRRYEGRKDLGNTRPGDGARFIGRGMLQLTGRDNYDRIGKAVDRWHRSHDGVEATENASPMCLGASIDLVRHPERASEFPSAIETACAFWLGRNINHFADQDSVPLVTQAINTGLLELPERMERTAKAKSLLDEPGHSELERGLRDAAAAQARG